MAILEDDKLLNDNTIDTLADIEDELNSIKAEQMEDNIADRQLDFLTDCMEQNLEHARHVEGERMDFIQIHLVLVGGVLAFLSESALDKKSIIVLIILIAVTLLGFFVKRLINRWDQVFAAHRACAMYCHDRITEICDMKEDAVTEFPMEILNNVKRKVPSEYRKRMPYYPFTFSQSGKTGKTIKWFINGLILVTCIVTSGYFVKFWLLPLI